MKLKLFTQSFVGALCALESGFILKELLQAQKEMEVILFGASLTALILLIALIVYVLRECYTQISATKSFMVLVVGIILCNAFIRLVGTEWLLGEDYDVSWHLYVVFGSFLTWIVYMIWKSVCFVYDLFVRIPKLSSNDKKKLWRKSTLLGPYDQDKLLYADVFQSRVMNFAMFVMTLIGFVIIKLV